LPPTGFFEIGSMKLSTLLPRFLVTLIAVILAGIVGWQLWVYYMLDPWTRDGRVRADIVEVAPDVSGLVGQVFIHDNQTVHVGEPLFQIDPVRFQLALRQAVANAASEHATLRQAQSDARRVNGLSGNAVSAQTRDQRNTDVLEAEAAYQSALADQAVAQLNLDRATVRAAVNGIVTNFSMQPGDYVTAGNAVAALVDTDSLYVDGYFEETKLPRIAIGDTARVTLLGGTPAITGHVQSIAAGIADTERAESPNLLANINPTFTWVRLAQRVPVRIQLDQVPASVRLIAGLTATVEIEQRK
jgi:multidrug resistance efflux pump